MIHKRRTIIYPVLLLPSIELKLKVIDGILRWHFTCVIHSNRPCYSLCYIFLLFIFIFYGRHAIEVDIFLLSPIILLMSILMTLSIAVEFPPLMLISNWFVCSLSYSPAYFMHEWLTRDILSESICLNEKLSKSTRWYRSFTGEQHLVTLRQRHEQMTFEWIIALHIKIKIVENAINQNVSGNFSPHKKWMLSIRVGRLSWRSASRWQATLQKINVLNINNDIDVHTAKQKTNGFSDGIPRTTAIATTAPLPASFGSCQRNAATDKKANAHCASIQVESKKVSIPCHHIWRTVLWEINGTRFAIFRRWNTESIGTVR